MRQKSIFVGIAVLLAVMIMACDTSTGPSPTGGPETDKPNDSPLIDSDTTAQQEAKANANALKAELEKTFSGKGIEVKVEGTTVTITKGDVPVTKTESITVGKGATLAVAAGVTIEVADEGTYGGEGTISIQAGGTLVDGNKRTGSDSYIFGNLEGTVEIAAGGKFQVNGGTSTDGSTLRTLVGNDDDPAAFLKISTASADKVTLQSGEDGSTITIAAGSVSLGRPNEKTLQLYENEKLVISKDATLTLTSGGDHPAHLNSNEGAVVQIDGTLVIKDGIFEALNIFNADTTSTGKIVVESGGQIVQVRNCKIITCEYYGRFKT